MTPEKSGNYTTDFLWGVFLIGGAPWAALGLCIETMESLEWLFKFESPPVFVVITSFIFLALAVFVFAWTIRMRSRRRIAPHWALGLEIFLGVAWAAFILMLLGVLSYPG
jgi:hypothetical protein